MASQEQSLLQQPPRDTPVKTSRVDLEVAQSLLQHSRRAQEADGDGMPISTQDPSTELPATARDDSVGNDAVEHGRENRQSNSQERQPDAQYAPISNPPALGQACRYVSFSRMEAIVNARGDRALTFDK